MKYTGELPQSQQDIIVESLRVYKEVEEFEAKYGEKPMTKSWRKWCTDYEYRKNEWEFRQGVHKNYKQITNAIG